MAYVYRHIRLDKNEPFYIGIGSKDDDDFKRAYDIKRRSIYWKGIFNKTKIEVEIVLDNITWDEAGEKEKEFIKMYGRRALGTGTLINMTDGGKGPLGVIISEVTRAKMSIANKGRKMPPFTEEHRKKLANSRIGLKLSKEHKLKISVAGNGIKRSDETKKKMSEWQKGKPSGIVPSEETRIKMSKAHKGQAGPNKGRIWTDEEKRNMSLGTIRYYENKRKQAS